jgi:hypothetical protein
VKVKEEDDLNLIADGVLRYFGARTAVVVTSSSQPVPSVYGIHADGPRSQLIRRKMCGLGFLRYPSQVHGFTGRAIKEFWERENAFFHKYLRPEQQPN